MTSLSFDYIGEVFLQVVIGDFDFRVYETLGR